MYFMVRISDRTQNTYTPILIREINEDDRPDRVIMNPPFSSTVGRIKKHDAHNAQPHIEEAMKLLKDNGRLVVIPSKSMSDANISIYEVQHFLQNSVSLQGNLFFRNAKVSFSCAGC